MLIQVVLLPWHSKRQEPQASTPMSSPVIILVVQGMKPKAQAGKYAIILLYSCLICNFIYIHKYPSELHMYITYKPKLTVSFVIAKNGNSPNLQKYFKIFYFYCCVCYLCVHAYRSQKRRTGRSPELELGAVVNTRCGCCLLKAQQMLLAAELFL